MPIATNAPQQTASLFDHFVGAGDQCRGHREAERLGGFEVDDQLKLRGLHHWKIRYPSLLIEFISIG